VEHDIHTYIYIYMYVRVCVLAELTQKAYIYFREREEWVFIEHTIILKEYNYFVRHKITLN